MKAALLSCDVLVVGAGPAGLAAAAAARECGADVICVDLFTQAGGQYSMRPVVAGGPFDHSLQVADGRTAEARCRELGVRFLFDTEIFWAEPGFSVFARQGPDSVTIRASAMVVASGAMERAIPFNGWTLPGVITAGAAQRLIKANRASPGKNVVLAGTGPFLLAVADTFAKAGKHLRAYVEMQRPALSLFSPFLHHPARFGEAVGLLQSLRRTRPAIHMGHMVTEALGDGRLEAVRVAAIGRNGLPEKDKSFLIENIDSLCIGYGFRPVIDITSLLHAAHHFDSSLGGWYCAADPATQQTDVPRLYAAGETTGIGGSVPARLSGRLAGLDAARAVGNTVSVPSMDGTRRALARARDFAASLAKLFPFPGHLIERLSPEEKVCRCEDVSRAQVEAAVGEGAADLFSVKMWTRAGMGPCQGRICGSALGDLVAGRLGIAAEAAGYNRPHMPLRPVPLNIAEAALALAGEPKESTGTPA
ncbi:NAD(P)/FAD-dependent oxidoreductase [Mesorhizobium sp. BAC0120]|uniref:NAD(P)/FAD-dependent oxidoreductase n=1 Tax=Mesorhizobium sp. BAC0120 TaxID=3090670 RepID=UPI00298C674B|nr:NAD(P)/FAD-dependent oxidoreductase [Mesorhizobium sp. BAC0120]MDW6023216.1 NAD(P)/FAD-dependent oxidoreductase [Mesorhizobium sp. BAC0120]